MGLVEDIRHKNCIINHLQPMEVLVSDAERFDSSSTSKGNQIKWFKDNTYIKADSMGYESIAEVIATLVMLNINSPYDAILYRMCNVHEKRSGFNDVLEHRGCLSENYLKAHESFISMYRLFQLYDSTADISLRELTGECLVKYAIDATSAVTGLDIYEYLGFLVRLDALILNEDRHFNNINLVYDTNSSSFRVGPVFDNGLSLLSDIKEYRMFTSDYINVRQVKSKTFSTSFMKQISYFDTEPILLNFDRLLADLMLFESMYQSPEALRVSRMLRERLLVLEGRVWQRV